jgi:Pyridoxamine 5'-phosphate oxidase
VATWAELEAAAPELAGPARALIERFRFVLLGTIRSDGTPRISPIEAHIVEGRLTHCLIAGTLKERDVRRDPRVVLNSPVLHAGDPNEELKLRGRFVAVTDPALRTAVADAIESASGWRPKPEWRVVETDLEGAALISWRGGRMAMTRWSLAAGLERVSSDVAVL